MHQKTAVELQRLLGTQRQMLTCDSSFDFVLRRRVKKKVLKNQIFLHFGVIRRN